MSKIKKADLLQLLQEQADMMAELAGMVEMNKQAIIKLENECEQPKPKQIDQSVFDGLDADYNFAAIDGCTGRAYAYEQKPHVPAGKNYWRVHDGMQSPIAYDYDTTDWRNSLIERDDIAKELLEVDLSSELTGSDLCRKMLERGDKFVLCFMSYSNDATAEFHERAEIVLSHDDKGFYVHDEYWQYAVPINNQGEPLTAADVDL